MWKMQQKVPDNACWPELVTVAAALKPAIVVFSSLTQPCAPISRETQQCCDEPSMVNWTQHNQSSCAFCWHGRAYPKLKVTHWPLCRLEKLMITDTSFQGFVWAVNLVLRMLLAMGMAWEMLEGVCGHRRRSLQYLTIPGLEYRALLMVTEGLNRVTPPPGADQGMCYSLSMREKRRKIA